MPSKDGCAAEGRRDCPAEDSVRGHYQEIRRGAQSYLNHRGGQASGLGVKSPVGGGNAATVVVKLPGVNAVGRLQCRRVVDLIEQGRKKLADGCAGGIIGHTQGHPAAVGFCDRELHPVARRGCVADQLIVIPRGNAVQKAGAGGTQKGGRVALLLLVPVFTLRLAPAAPD